MCTCCVNAHEQCRSQHPNHHNKNPPVQHHPYKLLDHWRNHHQVHTYTSSTYRRRMRQDGRRNRTRAGKLPKMNNSERGKYYRQKSKEYEDGLEDAAVILKKQIRDLELFLHMRDELARQNSTLSCSRTMVAHVFRVVKQARSSGELFTSVNGRSTNTLVARHTSLELELGGFHISGGGNSNSGSPTIITLQGVLYAAYTMQTLASLYPHIMSDEELVGRLLDQHVSYSTTFQFYFRSDGELQQYEVEVDEVQGLQRVLRSLDDVDFVLNDAVAMQPRWEYPTKSEYVDDYNSPVQIRIPESLSPCKGPKSEASVGSPMDLDFILCAF